MGRKCMRVNQINIDLSHFESTFYLPLSLFFIGDNILLCLYAAIIPAYYLEQVYNACAVCYAMEMMMLSNG